MFSFKLLATSLLVSVRNFVHFESVPPACEMQSNPMLLETDRQFDTKFHIGFDFATTRSSSLGFLYCICEGLSTGLKLLQENVETIVVLGGRGR